MHLFNTTKYKTTLHVFHLLIYPRFWSGRLKNRILDILVHPASEMTYTVSGGALNSTQTKTWCTKNLSKRALNRLTVLTATA